jgi:hypothetical protein
LQSEHHDWLKSLKPLHLRIACLRLQSALQITCNHWQAAWLESGGAGSLQGLRQVALMHVAKHDCRKATLTQRIAALLG